MNEGWYYAKNNQQFGPVSAEAVQSMARSGEIGPADLVWRAGMTDWQAASSVLDFDQLVGAAATAPSRAPDPGPAPLDPDNPFAAPRSEMAPEAFDAPQVAFHGYAGFWKRLVAAFLDGIILGAASYAVLLILMLLAFAIAFALDLEGGDFPDAAFISAMVVYYILALALPWLYEAYMASSSKQATVGKMALGIIVTDLYGRRITFGRATGRYFAKFLSSLTLLIGYLMAAFTERKQALHDMVAGTLVVNRY
jgi:uncharacterized RDD family membrane protein YckC